MFKKWKERLSEVSEEVKRDPRFQTGLASVNQLAENAVSALNRERSPSREAVGGTTVDDESCTNNANNDHLYTLGEDDELDEEMADTNDDPRDHLRRPRASSDSGNDLFSAAALFPIYEAPQQMYSLPSDLESSAGSEWGEDNASTSSQLASVSKEQLLHLLQKTRARQRKYKARFMEAANGFKEMQRENDKVKDVMQQTQDKALRRISELRDQCQLQEKAKRHLEEELRSDIEEKEHVISALETKIALLKNNQSNSVGNNGNSVGNNKADALGENSDLIDLQTTTTSGDQEDKKGDEVSNKVSSQQAEKIRRLEALLSKCKDTIETNKSKMAALTAVRESVATALKEKEEECERLRREVKRHEEMSKKAREEELQIAETKMIMHQEIIAKDEQMNALRASVQSSEERLSEQEKLISSLEEQLSEQRERGKQVEQLLETEKADALQEMSRGKTSALQKLKDDMGERMKELEKSHQIELQQQKERLNREKEEALARAHKEKERELKLQESEVRELLSEKDNECRLATEELELRLSSMTSNEAQSDLLQEMESQLSALKDGKAKEEGRLRELLSKSEEEVKQLKRDLETKVTDVDCIRSKNNELNEDFNRKTEEMTRQLDALNKDKDHLKLQLESSEEERAELETKLSTSKEESESSFARLEEETKHYRKQEEELQKKVEELEEKLRSEKDEHLVHVERLTEDVKTLRSNHDSVQSDMNAIVKAVGDVLDSTVCDNQPIGDPKALLAAVDGLKDELQSSKAALQKAKRELEKGAEQEQLIQTLKSEISQLKLTLQEGKERFECEVESLKQSINEKQSQLEVLQRRLTEAEHLQMDLTKEKDSLQEKLNGTVKDEMESQLRTRSDHLEAQVSELERGLEQSKASLSKSEERCQLLESKESEQELLVQRLRSDFEEVQKSLLQQTADGEAKTNDLKEQLSSQKDDFQLKLSELNKELQTSEQLCQSLKARESDLGLLNESLKSEMEHQKTLLEESNRKLEQYEVESGETLSNLQDRLSEAEREVKLAKEEKEVMQSMLDSKNTECCRYETQICEFTKELTVLRDRDRGNEELKQQMITYEKNLQGKIRLFEDSEQVFREESNELRTELRRKDDALNDLQERMDAELCRLRSELELKASNEGDRDTTLKELQSQSIEYQKRLQDQLEERQLQLNESNEQKQLLMSTHNREIELLTSKIDHLTGLITDLEASEKETKQSLALISEERNVLEEKVTELSDQMTCLESNKADQLALLETQLASCETKLSASCERETNLHSQLSSMRTDHELAVRKLEEEIDELKTSTAIVPTSMEDGWDHDTIDLQTNDETLAIEGSHSLEQSTEFEYLRNILFEYMMGKETSTLAKVLATIVKFSPEQLQAVIEHEERRHRARAAFKTTNRAQR